jgi:hypothetical protein
MPIEISLSLLSLALETLYSRERNLERERIYGPNVLPKRRRRAVYKFLYNLFIEYKYPFAEFLI